MIPGMALFDSSTAIENRVSPQVKEPQTSVHVFIVLVPTSQLRVYESTQEMGSIPRGKFTGFYRHASKGLGI